jgi:putative Ca2+/H+ antiporter (TMEM165/GDT1 family)
MVYISPVVNENNHAFFVSLAMVSMAEIFDKTWFVAFVMAMRFDKTIVFWSCFSGLLVHVFIAAAFGVAFNNILSARTLNLLAAALYSVFAVLYTYDWFTSEKDSDVIGAGKEEIAADMDMNEDVTSYGTQEAVTKEPSMKMQDLVRISWQCFLMVFIAEWGDRTQIAMIGIHATLPLIPVMLGSTLAFGLLTLSAVLLGKYLGNKTLSESTVKIACALSFVAFALIAIRDVILLR